MSIGCGMDIVKQSESTTSVDGIIDNDGNTEVPPTDNNPVLSAKYLGSCYKIDKKADDDEYCVDLESEKELNPDELSLGLLEAEEFCEEEVKDSMYVTEKCVDINNAMNDFKDVVVMMDPEKLCSDRIERDNFKIKASHILAGNEKGKLEFNRDEMECERKK